MNDVRKVLSGAISLICCGLGIALIYREMEGIPVSDADMIIVMLCGLGFAIDFYLRTKKF